MAISPRSAPFPYPYLEPASQFGECSPDIITPRSIDEFPNSAFSNFLLSDSQLCFVSLLSKIFHNKVKLRLLCSLVCYWHMNAYFSNIQFDFFFHLVDRQKKIELNFLRENA